MGRPLQKGWAGKYPLYYIAYNKYYGEMSDPGYMDGKYINVEVSYSQEDELIGLAADKCYVSQITASEMQSDYESKLKDAVNKSFFGRLSIKQGKQKGFD